jgi:hypothetical protein
VDRFVAEVPEAMGRGRVERDRVAGSELVPLESELDAEPSREHVAVLATGMTHESLVGRRRAADVVDHVEEVDVLVLVARQPLPDDPGVELDHVALVRVDHRPRHDRALGLGSHGGCDRKLVVVNPEDIVERDVQLGHDGVQRAHGGL